MTVKFLCIMYISLGLETRVWGKGVKANDLVASIDKKLIDYWFNTADTLVECYLSKRKLH
jgi:hypothetical protein